MQLLNTVITQIQKLLITDRTDCSFVTNSHHCPVKQNKVKNTKTLDKFVFINAFAVN